MSHQIRRRMTAIAQRQRPSIRGTPAAKERARKAARARWAKLKAGRRLLPQGDVSGRTNKRAHIRF